MNHANAQLEFADVSGGANRPTTELASIPTDAERSGIGTARKPQVMSKPRAITSGIATAVESLLTFAEAARVLGISLRQFRRLVDGGRVAFVKVSERTPRVRPSELQRFLDASAVKYSEVQS